MQTPNGILPVDKPAGWTSFDVLAKLRGALGTRKLGHSGTLDPMATGVLAVFIGKATSAADRQLDHDKTYEATLRLGLRTDTGDVTGTTLETAPVTVGEAELRAVLPQFRGDRMQLPPMYSAVKINGQPLYKAARKGQTVERTPRPITIYDIEYLGSREGILKEKLDILRASLKNTVGIFNGDEPLLWNVRGLGDHKKYYYGIDNPDCDVVASGIQELEDGVRFRVSGFGHEFELFVPALGRHMVYNALAAATVGLLLEVKPETMQNELSIFQNTGMRQKVYEKNGMTIIEDCYNAGPESTEAALGVLASIKTSGKRIAVLGDMLELGNRSSAEHYRIGRIAAQKADLLLTYGAHSVRTVTGAITGGMPPKHAEHFDTHEDLARVLKMRAGEGDVILFKGSRGMKMERSLQLFLDDTDSAK